MSTHRSDEDIGVLQRRVPLLLMVVLLFIVVVMTRLYYLQVHRGQSYRSMAEQISVREEELRAPRGLILDRHGKVIADNRYYFEIVAIPQYLENKDKSLESLSKLIPVAKEVLEEKLFKARYQPKFFPVVLVEDAPFDWITRVRQHERPEYGHGEKFYLAGISVRVIPLRTYKYPEMFSHALGYLKELDKNELKKYDEKFSDRYSLGDLMGASGLERAYDLDLRGFDGVKARVVDAKGREVTQDPDLETLQQRASHAPVAGYNLMTSIDFKAQQAASVALEGKRGSVVAIDPNTGEVLVLISTPGFDANRIMKNIDKAYWQKINLHEDKILYNRAVQAAYPPGSIYKVVPAFAGLDLGLVTPETQFSCHGGIKFGSRFFKCWNLGGHGTVNLLKGLGQSCDVYFYQVGLKVGVDNLKKYAKFFGLAQNTGIEIAYEQPGLIPSSEWKMRRFKQPWIESETLSISIGQGYDLVTPLQAAHMVAMIANGGRAFTPRLGKEIKDSYGKTIREIKSKFKASVIPGPILEELQKGLIEVVHGNGTARRMQASPYLIAGKTGTAQVIGHDSKLAMTDRRKPHGWFMAYAPYDDPKIALVAIVENGVSGGASAGPVVKEVVDAYLSQIIPIPEKEKDKEAKEEEKPKIGSQFDMGVLRGT